MLQRSCWNETFGYFAGEEKKKDKTGQKDEKKKES